MTQVTQHIQSKALIFCFSSSVSEQIKFTIGEKTKQKNYELIKITHIVVNTFLFQDHQQKRIHHLPLASADVHKNLLVFPTSNTIMYEDVDK